jgi:ABC-type multidrug transport system ATPase subunit
MASLKIVELGEPVLRQKCRRVSVINKKVKKLLTDMKEAMYEANGLGFKKNGDHLSGGMRKKILFARAMINDPSCFCWTSPRPAWMCLG